MLQDTGLKAQADVPSAARPVTTLLVDDDRHLRELTRTLLEDCGRFRIVAEAEDGEAAIALAKQHRPSLILLDLAMPITDGFEALPRLRKEIPDGKIVVFTIKKKRAEFKRAIELGADKCIGKWGDAHRILPQLFAVCGFHGSAPDEF